MNNERLIYNIKSGQQQSAFLFKCIYLKTKFKWEIIK